MHYLKIKFHKMQLLNFLLLFGICFQSGNSYFESRMGYLPWHYGDSRNALKVDDYKWPNAVVPYVIDDSIRELLHY